MTEWMLEPIEKMPPRTYSLRASFAEAVRDLADGEALFMPAREGETVTQVTNRIQSTLSRLKAHGRRDHARNGVWVYKNGVKTDG